MHRIPWVVLFVALACGKSDGKQPENKKPPVEKPVEDKPAPGTKLSGFYRLDSATLKGKKLNLEDAFRASLKGDGDQELDMMRMTFEFSGDTLTIGMDQILGSPGDASYCSVRASSELVYSGGKFTAPLIKAEASAGHVTASDGNDTKDTTKCNVSLEKGVYEIKGSSKNVDLIGTSDGEQVTLHLIADDKEVDLKARATKFAQRKK